MYIFSGIGPGNSGVGQLVNALKKQSAERADNQTQIYWRPAPPPEITWTKRLRRGSVGSALRSYRQLQTHRKENAVWQSHLQNPQILDAPAVTLLHHQLLGATWCRQMIQARRQPTWLYLADSAFFCARSYNYIAGEQRPCLRCLGGDWENSTQFECNKNAPTAFVPESFLQSLREWAAGGKVRFAAQNTLQAELARQHFGETAIVKTVGLWVGDWDDLFDNPPQNQTLATQQTTAADVVFHGNVSGAKGFYWALGLARRCPKLSFVFPCSLEASGMAEDSVPPNVTFRDMRWNTGLREAVSQARFVLNPSLWSCPIEGALVKSMMQARAVAVVDTPTGFSKEIPDALVLRLSPDLKQAAEQLQQSYESNWFPDAGQTRQWMQQFSSNNRQLLSQLYAAIEQ